ncbi:Activating signal cointegrator 1 [Habropoda laboriosa]|uniref:Activating signal cointegrator 1 n=1 Tax=Habropoda laboriosa TaxID=597456 RepID=A0A0L7RC76_9HYME|nr:Activating signal cointegrator 1 [Habropoda laboriosa]
MDNLECWISRKLDDLLGKPIPSYILRHIAEIKKEDKLITYLGSILNFDNEEHRQFIVDLKKQRAIIKDQANKKGEVKTKENKKNKQMQETVKVEKIDKKKSKFVNLYSQEGQDKTVVLLKGRHKCDCEAKRHALINNCLNCGRIVCFQEGSGPCFFCGELVCSHEEEATINSTKRQADQLYNKLMNQKPNKYLEESIKQRDKLIEYDRNGVQCTKIIDDECDYYQSSNMWLTAEQREKSKKFEENMSQTKHMSRLNRKLHINFDFTGREVTEDNSVEDFNEFNEEQFQDILESFSDSSSNICPNIEFNRPMYIESDESELQMLKANIPLKTRNVVQDKEFLEMCDPGLCLSMHQPYASLLVAGIKVHEGRIWYSSHRGRLWIAAASKTPTKEEISNMEHYYRVLKDEKLKFPESYPTSCLLGCVSVVDVLPQEEYRKSYPEGESDSPYVFICENFYTLPIKFPMQGAHKIYKLDKKIHYAALKIIEKMSTNKN